MNRHQIAQAIKRLIEQLREDREREAAGFSRLNFYSDMIASLEHILQEFRRQEVAR
jgi:hypothetical protein